MSVRHQLPWLGPASEYICLLAHELNDNLRVELGMCWVASAIVARSVWMNVEATDMMHPGVVHNLGPASRVCVAFSGRNNVAGLDQANP